MMSTDERRKWLTFVINNPEEKMETRLKAMDLLNRMDDNTTQQSGVLRISWEAPDAISNTISETISEVESVGEKEAGTKSDAV